MASSEHHLSIKKVQAILQRQFPSLQLESLEYIQEGGDSHTYELNRTWIFRFPRIAADAARMQREVRILLKLAPALPLPVPVPHYTGQPGPLYPFPFIGHRKIEGVSGETLRPAPEDQPAIARQLGQFLSCLHGYPAAQLQEHDLPVLPLENMAGLLDRVVQVSDLIARQIPEHITPAVEKYLSGQVALPPAGQSAPVVSHADFKGEHLLLSQAGRTITGIIDWTDICLADPVVDFTGLMFWLGEPFLKQLLEHYTCPTDNHFLERICFTARCRTLINLGERLAGESEAPLRLLLTQMNWAFCINQ